jgi:beta-glucosidase
MELIDESVLRNLIMKFRLGLFEESYVDESKTQSLYDTPEDREVAGRIARESCVLLKNENQLLPLKKEMKSIAVIGPNADSIRNMLGDYTYPCHIEFMTEVKGDENTLNQPVPENVDPENIHMPEMISFLTAIKEKVSESTEINYAKGCEIQGDSTEGFVQAVEVAKKSEVALIFVGDKAGLHDSCTSGETRDCATLILPGQQAALIRAVAETGTPVVLVLVSGMPYSLVWEDENIPAILEAWLPGAEGGNAVADVLFGDYNPGGKLTISFPRSVGQIPTYYSHKKSGGRSHWKGDYIDSSTKPLYPFGYGMSYTEFKYNDFSVNKTECGMDESVEVAITVKNIGEVKGDEIVQLYINDPHASVTRPVKELKGFKRITLEAGQSKRVIFTLSVNQLGFYGTDMNFIVEPGEINVMIGRSSNQVEGEGRFKITGNTSVIDKKVFFSTSRVE